MPIPDPICIFCPNLLTKDTKPEHILHNGLGGRKTTRRVLCSACNNGFGSGIDKVLVEQFAVVRNLLQIRSGTGELPPMIKNAKAGNDTITVHGDGEFQLIKKPFVIIETPDGHKQLQILGDSLEHIETYVPHMAAALRVSEEELRHKLAETAASVHERYPAPFEFSLSFGGPEAIRSAAKACMVLWSVLVGNEEVRRGPYNAALEYIRDGNEGFHTSRTDLDSRCYEESERLVAQYGPAYNMIYVKSNSEGKVIGHFTALNLIGFAVVLAESGGQPNRQIALVSNPLTGAWSSDVADEFDVPFGWFEQPNYDYDTMHQSKARFETLMIHQRVAARSRQLERLIKKVLETYGLKENDIIPSELFSSISGEIASRAAHMLMGIGSKKPISQDEMRQKFIVESKTTKRAFD